MRKSATGTMIMVVRFVAGHLRQMPRILQASVLVNISFVAGRLLPFCLFTTFSFFHGPRTLCDTP
jgi:hypothetical protein